jgi:hypothetical protein
MELIWELHKQSEWFIVFYKGKSPSRREKTPGKTSGAAILQEYIKVSFKKSLFFRAHHEILMPAFLE